MVPAKVDDDIRAAQLVFAAAARLRETRFLRGLTPELNCNSPRKAGVFLIMLVPLAESEWDYRKAAHLLNRAGFGGTPAEVNRLVPMGPAKAVSALFEFTQSPATAALPEWAKPDPDRAQKFRRMRDATEAERKELRKEQQQQQKKILLDFRHWWLDRMRAGPAPLQEKLVLFWHGHFATSAQKVKDAWLMIQQNDIFRRHAAGNWLELLSAVSKDPAMLVWLDQAQSRKDHPNENFAREVMELFTLGEGHYTEKDVTEAARALTGWTFDRVNQSFQYRARLHDTGTKTVLGRTGAFDGDDILRLIVAHPTSAEFIVRKLWVFFANDHPSDATIGALAAIFRQNGHNFPPVLEAMFRSREFYSDAVVRQQIKSPVQWLVGSVKLLQRDLPPENLTSGILRMLGQELFLPPNVKGWDGGLAWITTNNLLSRYNIAYFLITGENPLNMAKNRKKTRLARARGGTPVDVDKIVPGDARKERAKTLAYLEMHFIQGPLKPSQEKVLRDFLESVGELDDSDLLHAIHLVMATPEYQLA